MSAPSTDRSVAQRALRHEVGAVRLRRDVVRAAGPDALTYLQGQLSQDLQGLQPGSSTMALVLKPGGKVDAWVRVWGREGDEVLLDIDAGAGPGLMDRLNRFRLRVAVELELLDWEMVALRGPHTPPTGAPGVAAELCAAVDWAGLQGLDLLGPTVAVPAGIAEVDEAALTAVRIEAGRPAVGSELGPDLDPLVIPAEAGEWLIEESVSFTKGCYTGQELVARVDSRGSNTPRKLRGIVLQGDHVPPPGAEVLVDGTVRGIVTSSGWSVEIGAPIALSYVHRSVEPGSAAAVAGADAQVRALPLVGG